MNEHFDPILRGGPLTGVVLALVGFVGYLGATISRVLEGSGHLIAQADPGPDGHAQLIYGVMSVVGAVIAGWSLIQGKINEARREEQRRDAEARREEQRRDDDARRERETKDAMAQVELHLAEHRAAVELQRDEMRARLGRQDHDLAIIKDAVATPKPDETP